MTRAEHILNEFLGFGGKQRKPSGFWGSLVGGGVQNPVKSNVKTRNNPAPVPKQHVDIAHASKDNDAPSMGSPAYKAARLGMLKRVVKATPRRDTEMGITKKRMNTFNPRVKKVKSWRDTLAPKDKLTPNFRDRSSGPKYKEAKANVLSRVTQAKKTAAGK